MSKIKSVNTFPVSEKLEILKHTMNRYDHYYDSINNKGNLFLTLNTFLLGGMITGYYSMKETIAIRCGITLFVWAGLICCLLSLVLTLWAIIPYLNKPTDSIKRSVMNFSDVSNVSFENFTQLYANMNEKSRYEDYLKQVYLLGCGLQRKFLRLKTAAYLLGGCFTCIIIVGIKILK